MPPAIKYVSKQQIFAHCTPTHNDAQDTNSMHHSIICLKSQKLTSIFTTTMVRPARELYATGKMAADGMDHSGPAVVDDEAVVVPLKDTAQNTRH